MEKSEMINSNKEVVDEHEFQEIVKSLTKETNFHSNYILYHYKGCWCPSQVIKAMLSFRKHFQPKNDDIIVASAFKSGTTWLKALTFSVINRAKYSLVGTKESPLLTNNPHSLVYNLEFEIYSQDELVTIEDIASPRILNTHAPFEALPQSMLNSKCRIVYICRNPLDQFISYWHFNCALLKNQGKKDTPSIDEAFELFCRGVHSFGPFWEHAMGYWRSSIERPDKVLFLKYEDLKDDINSNVKKIAEFLEFPFTKEEENKGLVEEISELCEFENLKNLQVNKVGIQTAWLANRDFFRKGQVGDWVNYLSLPQAERLEKIAKEKLSGSGLTFKSFCKT